MGLKAMICPQCKGSIAVDEDKKTLKCEYCGTPFLTEDVINYNYTIQKTTIDIDHVENLTVNDSKIFPEIVLYCKNEYIGLWLELRILHHKYHSLHTFLI